MLGVVTESRFVIVGSFLCGRPRAQDNKKPCRGRDPVRSWRAAYRRSHAPIHHMPCTAEDGHEQRRMVTDVIVGAFCGLELGDARCSFGFGEAGQA
jgi:hypothetical protein